MGDYLHSKGFELYTIENDIDDLWTRCRQLVQSSRKVIMLGFHNTEDEEEAFMHMIDALSEDEDHMDEIIIETFVGFAEWSKISHDFTGVYKALDKLEFTKETIKRFAKAVDSAMLGKPTKEEASRTPDRQVVKKSGDSDAPTQQDSMNPPISKVFISHASANKKVVDELVELLELVGVPSDKIFYSSLPEYGIAPGEDFLARIKTEISEGVLVVFAMSRQFLDSPTCLCEMGAAWVLSRLHIPVVIPPFRFSDIRGVIPLTQGTTINDPREINVFAKRVADTFGLPSPLQNPTWERKRDRILDIINERIAREAEETKQGESRSSIKGSGTMPIGGVQF
ncbi:toll/interleukin-1 receptor domain-containing protein [Hymenobacter actinosclerus]|uniref:TIR domain-containing protein n=1 Tax=Hymenobacter actinosclerus TaxID=82805 RepID=A0A1I0IEZ1_9BACT|nr:toll/interleukin-1 receptor domain-containing protein [Hymenobacter actinosclerus]SET94797.1 TIR domain-containing protein [Hymenobacter actinosclerus]